MCPTPSLQLAVGWLGAEGGISITAGHNPEPWNALKFVRADGLYLNATQSDELLDIYHQGEFAKATWREIRSRVEREDAVTHHLDKLARAFDVETIRRRRLTVAVDCCNSSCALLSPRWLDALGCNVLAVNDDPTAPFPHAPEPGRQTMAQLRASCSRPPRRSRTRDGERLGISGTARCSEEATLASRGDQQQRVGAVVTNIRRARRRGASRPIRCDVCAHARRAGTSRRR